MLDFYQHLIRKGRVIFSGVLFFSFALFVTPAAADTPIAFGETISATIGSFGEIDKYTFDAVAGDLLAISMSTTIPMDAYIRLYTPDGSLINQAAIPYTHTVRVMYGFSPIRFLPAEPM